MASRQGGNAAAALRQPWATLSHVGFGAGSLKRSNNIMGFDSHGPNSKQPAV